MCVIIAKPKGVELPSMKELQSAYRHNPDGCGVVSSNGIYWRGLSFKKFCEVIKKVNTEDACIIHFRIGTHGSNKTSNCHPFVANYNNREIFFAHNGILPIQVRGDMTDSETEFRNILAPAAFTFGIRSERFKALVDREIYSSKFAFMENGEISLFGSWIAEGGLFWSNLNHRHHTYTAPQRPKTDTASFMNRFYTKYPQYKNEEVCEY